MIWEWWRTDGTREYKQHVEGDSIIMSDKAVKVLIEWKPLKDTLAIFRINSKYAKLAVITGYVREMSW